MKISAAPLFLVLFAAPLAAQYTPYSPADFENTNTISLSLSGLPTFKRVVSGRLIGDGAEHAVLLAGTQIVFLYEPSVSSSVHLLFGAANDLDVAPRVSANPDGIATVSGDGLKLYTFNGNNFVSTPIPTTIDWLNAQRVRADDINATGVTDYVGINAGGTKMLVRRDVSGVPTETWFNLSHEVKDMLLVQWDNDANLEIAVLDTYGVHVFEYSGTTVESFPDAGDGVGAFAKFRVSTDARDRIAWLVDLGGGSQELRELSKRNPNPVVGIPNMPYGGVALAGGNGYCSRFPSKEDGNWELVVMRSASYSPLVLHNLHTLDSPIWTDPNPSFVIDPPPTPVHYGYLTGGMPALENITGPSSKPILYCDLNGDDLPDLLIPIVVAAGQQSVAFWRGTKNASASSAVVYTKAELPETQSSPDTRNLHVALTLPTAPGWSNCLEAILWQQDYDVDGAPRTGLGHWYYLLSPPPLTANPQIEIPVTVNLVNPQPCFAVQTAGRPVVFWLELRYGRFLANKFERVGESFIAHLASDMGAADDLIISDLLGGPSKVLCLSTSTACEWDGQGKFDPDPGCLAPLTDIGSSLVRTPSLVSRGRMPPSIGNVPQAGPVSGPMPWYPGTIQ